MSRPGGPPDGEGGGRPGPWGGGSGGRRGGFMGGGGPMGLTMPVEKPRNAKGAAVRLLAYFGRSAPLLTLIGAAAILSTGFAIVSPRILGDITTDLYVAFERHVHGAALGGDEVRTIAGQVELLAGLYVMSAAFSWVQQYLMAGVAQRTVYTIRREVMEKLSRLPVGFYDAHPHGEVLSRFVNDFDNIGTTLQQSLTQSVTAVFTFLGVVLMMLTISPLMTVAIALTLPLSFFVTRGIATRSQRYFVDRQRRLGVLNGHVEEMYTGHVVVKAFGHEGRSVEAFDAMNADLAESTWKAQFVTGIIMPLMNVIGNLGFVVVSVVGGILVLRRSLQIGDIQAFIQYARQFSQPITQLASISNSIQSALASSERVFEILDEPEEAADPEDPSASAKVAGDVRFADASFSYSPDRPLIVDMNVSVASGQTVAVVGPTGAGKTTLVNLLMRFYDLDRGAILVDGVDVRRMKRPDLRRMFGMVLQDTWLFNDTIRANIAYGRDGATTAEVTAAARMARADHFIRTLPDGYDTVLNEEASNISQGQRQLLTIARAILANPPILILDEATSSVDSRTEVAIQGAMKELMRGRTSFVIAHRLSTIRGADLILVMDHGSVVEQGTHASLLATGGLYAELYMSQFAHSEAPVTAAGGG